MTTAERLAEYKAAMAMELAEDELDAAADQDWEAGSTIWTFRDGSRMRVCGTEVEALPESSE